jgi:hypothetical protein
MMISTVGTGLLISKYHIRTEPASIHPKPSQAKNMTLPAKTNNLAPQTQKVRKSVYFKGLQDKKTSFFAQSG